MDILYIISEEAKLILTQEEQESFIVTLTPVKTRTTYLVVLQQEFRIDRTAQHRKTNEKLIH